MLGQTDLFDTTPVYPEGFRYEREVLSRAEELEALEHIRELPFREFEFHGFTGKRRVVSFGWRYDFSNRVLLRSEELPAFLLPIREVAARFAGMPPEAFQHALVTEYSAGAAIGWHKDKAEFGEVIGLSLAAPCVFRLRRRQGSGWERVTIEAEPRSAYLMSGPSRSEWEHSIPPVDSLRYSITFRSLREGL